MAEVTVSNVYAETTFTATYQNVSATCTVNVQSYIFRDGGVTGDVNTNYTNISNRCIIAIDTAGTKVSSNTYADSYYRENVLIQGDFRATFTIVDVQMFGGVAFLNTSNSKQFMVEYNLYDSPNKLFLSIGSTDYLLSNDISLPKTITMERVGTTITVKMNGTQVGSSQTVTSADGYLAWKTHSDKSRSVKFKDFTIEAL